MNPVCKPILKLVIEVLPPVIMLTFLIVLPLSFYWEVKGRYESLFMYTVCVTIYLAVSEMSIIPYQKGHLGLPLSSIHSYWAVLNYPFYGLIFLFHLFAFFTSSSTDRPIYFWGFIFPSQLLVFIPSLLVMPLLAIFTEISLEKLFAPVYIDIIVAALASLISRVYDIFNQKKKVAKNEGAKLVLWYMRYHIKILKEL